MNPRFLAIAGAASLLAAAAVAVSGKSGGEETFRPIRHAGPAPHSPGTASADRTAYSRSKPSPRPLAAVLPAADETNPVDFQGSASRVATGPTRTIHDVVSTGNETTAAAGISIESPEFPIVPSAFVHSSGRRVTAGKTPSKIAVAENRATPAKVRKSPVTSVAAALALANPPDLTAHQQSAVTGLNAYVEEASEAAAANAESPEAAADEIQRISVEADEYLRITLGKDGFNQLSFLAAANRKQPLTNQNH